MLESWPKEDDRSVSFRSASARVSHNRGPEFERTSCPHDDYSRRQCISGSGWESGGVGGRRMKRR
jgi:hypothetical protein